MKKLTLMTLLASAVLIALIFANFQMAMAAGTDDVSNTKHNLATIGGGVNVYGGEICVYCHTPHNSSAMDAPLWNRLPGTAAFTPYNSPSFDSTVITAPTGVSLACLGCHDGSIGLDIILNQPGTAGDSPVASGGTTMNNTGNANYNPMLGGNLSDDHPISIEYAGTGGSGLDTAFKVLNAVTGLRFFDDAVPGKLSTIQCATCHNPHGDSGIGAPEKFLRVANTGSALCVKCHDK